MGQQQLLLVILVTIIVGIATVVAINTFSSASDQANLDAVRNDLTQVASAAHSYYMKPTMLGGGGNEFTGITFNDITFAADSIYNSGLSAANANGSYVISGVGADEFTVTATAASAGGTIAATVVPNSIEMGDYTPPAE